MQCITTKTFRATLDFYKQRSLICKNQAIIITKIVAEGKIFIVYPCYNFGVKIHYKNNDRIKVNYD